MVMRVPSGGSWAESLFANLGGRMVTTGSDGTALLWGAVQEGKRGKVWVRVDEAGLRLMKPTGEAPADFSDPHDDAFVGTLEGKNLSTDLR